MWNRQELWKAFFRHKFPDAPENDKFTHTTKVTRKLYDKLNRGEIIDDNEKEFVEVSIKKVFKKFNDGEITSESEKQYVSNLSKEIRENYLVQTDNNLDDVTGEIIFDLRDTVRDIRFEFNLPQGMQPITMDLVTDFRIALSQMVNWDYGNYGPPGIEESERRTSGILNALRDIHWDYVTESDICQFYIRRLRLSGEISDIGLERLNEYDERIISIIASRDVPYLCARKEYMGKLVIQKMENSDSDILHSLAEKALLNYGDFFGHDIMDLIVAFN